MKVEQTSKQDQIAKITIEITPEDYLPLYKAELAKLKGKVNLKGFRQGRTPDHVISRMYGEQAMAEVLNKSFSNALDNYINTNEVQYVCQPMIAEDQEMIDIQVADKERVYAMTYDIGLLENLHIAGVSKEDSYTHYKITATEADIADNISKLTQNMGEFEEIDGQVEEFDKISVSAVEVVDGKSPKAVWQSAFEFHVSSVPTEEVKNLIIGCRKGAKLPVKLSELTRMAPERIRTEWLQLEQDDTREVGDDFEITIESVVRKMPMKLNDETVVEKFGEHGLNTVEELKERMATNLEASNHGLAIDKLYSEMYKRISDDSTMTFSDTFVKRWLVESEKVELEKLDETLEGFKKDLRWSIIQNELRKKYNVTVNREELKGYFAHKANEFMQQYGFYDEGIYNRLLERMQNDQNEQYNASNMILTNKILSEVEKDITKIEETITLEAFNKMTAPEQTVEEAV